MSQALTPVVALPGVASRVTLNFPGGIYALKVTNGTPFDLTVSGFGFNGSGIIPAGLEYMLYAEVENSGAITILPINNNNINGTGVVNLTAYFPDEPKPVGQWPSTVPTQTVQAKVSTVTDLINDGNVTGHQFLESTVSGAPGSTWSFINDGNGSFIGVLIANVVHKLIQMANSGNELKLGEAGNATEILGQLLVDQLATFAGNILANGGINTNTIRDDVNGNVAADLSNGTGDVNFKQAIIIENQKNVLGKDTGGTARIILFTGSGSDTILRACGVGSQILFQTQDGVNQGTVNANGFTIPKANSHGFTWFNGNFIPEISFFTGTGSGTYNHGWNGSGESGVPFWIAPIVDQSGSATQGYDSVTSTQCHVTLGAALAFKAFAV